MDKATMTDDITFEPDEFEVIDNEERTSGTSSIVSSVVSSYDDGPEEQEEEEDSTTAPSEDELVFTDVPPPREDDPLEKEVYEFLDRHLVTALPYNVDMDLLYRVLCARPMCDKRMAFMIEKAEQKFLQCPLIAEIAAFGSFSDSFDWQKEWDGKFTPFSASTVIDVFKSSRTPAWHDEPISIVVFATMVAVTLNQHFPEQMIFQGAKYYVQSDSDAHKQLQKIVGPDARLEDVSQFWKKMQAKFGTPGKEAESIQDVVHRLMKEGFGWIRFGDIGYIVPNDVINYYSLDQLPFPFNNLQRYQIAQFVGNILYGNSKDFCVFKNFTMVHPDFRAKMHKYFETCNTQRRMMLNESLGDRIAALASELEAEAILHEFNDLDQQRDELKKNVDGIMKWISQFNEAVTLDKK